MKLMLKSMHFLLNSKIKGVGKLKLLKGKDRCFKFAKKKKTYALNAYSNVIAQLYNQSLKSQFPKGKEQIQIW